MTIGKDNTNQRIDRVRRESARETDAQVMAFTADGSGDPVALSGEPSEGPYVAPVGDRPSRHAQDILSWADNGTLAQIESFSDIVNPNVFIPIDVREWRTLGLQFTYDQGFLAVNNGGEISIVQIGRLVWRLEGSFNSNPDHWIPLGVMDGTLLTNFGNFSGAGRTVYDSWFITPVGGVTATTLNFDQTFDVDPYDFVRVVFGEYDPEDPQQPQAVNTPGTLTLYSRRVR